MSWLIGSIVVFILFFLLIIILVFKKSKPAVSTTRTQKSVTLESLIEVLKTEKIERAKIEQALSKMMNTFPFPDNESEANKHFKFVYLYAKNPLTNAKMIVEMQKKLSDANPKYAKQIENFQMSGVEARKK